MKTSRFLILLLAVASCTSIGVAQNREKYGISAKAGGINAVVGRVLVIRQGQSAQLVTSSDDLAAGDVVQTDALSNVEILLNPGSYLRLAENTEFEFQDSALESLGLKLVKGSAIIEATGVNDMNLQIKVITPQARLTIIRSGVYRIDVQPNVTELAVRKGRATFGPNRTDVVKGGNKVTFANGSVARAKLSKDKDSFEVWSKQRAELLARANEKLSNRVFSGYLASMSGWDWGFSGVRSGGLWTYSPRARCYTFMPFIYGWSSPYGHYYGNYYNFYAWPGFGCCPGSGSGPTIVNNQQPPGSTGVNPGGTPPGGFPSPQPAPAPAPMAVERPTRIDAGNVEPMRPVRRDQ